MFRSFSLWGIDSLNEWLREWIERTVDFETLMRLVVDAVVLNGVVDGTTLVRHVREMLATHGMGAGFPGHIQMSIILCATFELIDVDGSAKDFEILRTRRRTPSSMYAYARVYWRLPKLRFARSSSDETAPCDGESATVH